MKRNIVQTVLNRAAHSIFGYQLSGKDPGFYESKAAISREMRKEFGPDFAACELLPGQATIVLRSEPDAVVIAF